MMVIRERERERGEREREREREREYVCVLKRWNYSKPNQKNTPKSKQKQKK